VTAPFDSPVAGIVDAGGHFVGQATDLTAVEKLYGQHTDVLQFVEDTKRGIFRSLLNCAVELRERAPGTSVECPRGGDSPLVDKRPVSPSRPRTANTLNSRVKGTRRSSKNGAAC